MKKILILFAHPAFGRSKINAAMRRAVENLENLTFHDLYSCYPDFHIDVKREQELCENHDIIILQHPFYWYSTPSILKEWLDLVLEHDWAYGKKGTALEGKYFFQALTAGGDDAAYQPSGSNLFTISELTSPYRATANLCKMNWLPPFAVLGIHRGLPDHEIQQLAEEYRKILIAMRDGTFNLTAAADAPYLNTNLRKHILQL